MLLSPFWSKAMEKEMDALLWGFFSIKLLELLLGLRVIEKKNRERKNGNIINVV
jgi:hypothetical protein